jgi:hypothetical protein
MPARVLPHSSRHTTIAPLAASVITVSSLNAFCPCSLPRCYRTLLRFRKRAGQLLR